ncbi:hypothetical protein ACTXT7_008315 [Hymenolepis weldensis]
MNFPLRYQYFEKDLSFLSELISVMLCDFKPIPEIEIFVENPNETSAKEIQFQLIESENI